MSTRAILDLLNTVETTFPVHTWTIDGVAVWPLLRFRLANGMTAVLQATATERSVGQYARTALQSFRHYAQARRADPAGEGRLDRPVDALFLSDGVSFVKLTAGWYERFCDPLIDAFTRAGHRTALMTPLDRYQTPRRTPSTFLQPRLDALRLATLVEARLGRHKPERRLAEYEAFRAFLAERQVPEKLTTLGPLDRQVALIRRYARYFEGVLARTRPALGLQVSYYGNIGMAFNLACRARGIPSVDLQHGVQGALHPAYAGWAHMPETGYALLPTYFWTWSEAEAAVIRAWSAPVAAHHRPVVGGNLLLEHWATLDPEAVAGHTRRIEAIQATHPGARHLLVTLHGLETPEELEKLVQMLAAGEANWFWWLRCHPARPEQARALSALLAERNLSGRFEIEAATQIPLYSLLPQMDLHVTECSSSVIEAAQRGLPTVITTGYGADLFPAQIASGEAVLAETPGAIATAIGGQLGRHLAPHADGTRDGLQVLAGILAARGAKGVSA